MYEIDNTYNVGTGGLATEPFEMYDKKRTQKTFVWIFFKKKRSPILFRAILDAIRVPCLVGTTKQVSWVDTSFHPGTY